MVLKKLNYRDTGTLTIVKILSFINLFLSTVCREKILPLASNCFINTQSVLSINMKSPIRKQLD